MSQTKQAIKALLEQKKTTDGKSKNATYTKP